jgi:hypothetical protein
MPNTLARRLALVEQRRIGVDYATFRAAEYRQQGRLCAELLVELRGEARGAWSSEEWNSRQADEAMIKQWSAAHGWGEPERFDLLTFPIAGLVQTNLDILGQFWHPAAPEAARLLTAWAQAQRAAGQNPDQALFRLEVLSIVQWADAMIAAGWRWREPEPPLISTARALVAQWGEGEGGL